MKNEATKTQHLFMQQVAVKERERIESETGDTSLGKGQSEKTKKGFMEAGSIAVKKGSGGDNRCNKPIPDEAKDYSSHEFTSAKESS